ncbi:MAG: hypothetical protein Q7U05_01010 [Polaromonas sp.]|nr:hypothetical protein [Polaromonas sp.]
MSASIITPTKLTDAMVVSSTVPETDFPVWTAGTFAVGDKRIMTTGIHRIYQCQTAHTSTDSTGAPNLNITGTPPKWLNIAPTNKWAMFDEKIGTISTLASPLTVVINPGPVSGLALLELTGRTAEISLKDQTDGTVVYSRTVDLDGTIVTSFFDWFFAEFAQQTDLTLTDLPSQFFNGELTISVTSTAGNVACGVAHVGKVSTLGETQMGATIGIISYSVKQTDAFGNLTIIKRQNSKRASWKLMIEKSELSRIFRLLASMESVLCVYSATTEPGYEPLILYGFFRDFNIDITYPTYVLTSLEIEGLAQ